MKEATKRSDVFMFSKELSHKIYLISISEDMRNDFKPNIKGTVLLEKEEERSE